MGEPTVIRKMGNAAILLFVFLAALRPPIDLDLGWHLRYGQYFFEHGSVLKENILSVVWPSYRWVQASWGYDLLVYQVFRLFGFLGISVAGALLTLLIFVLLTWGRKISLTFKFFLAFIFLVLTAPLYGTGMRSQTPSALLFTLAFSLYFWLRKKLYGGKAEKWQFLLLPLTFLVWANMHGGFAVGIILIFLIWAGEGLIGLLKQFGFIKSSLFTFKCWLKMGSVLLVSAVVPIFNPWGFALYGEVFKHSSNVNLAIISEWMPLTPKTFEWYLSILIVVFTIFCFLRRRKVDDLPFLASLVIAGYLAFSAARFFIIFGIMITYYLANNWQGMVYPKFFKKTWRLIFSSLLWVLLLALFFIDTFGTHRYFEIPNIELLNFGWEDYCQVIYIDDFQAKDCSEGVTKVMLADLPRGVGFHPYNYGGYLAWRVPQVKTFVDGRMPSWEENGKTPPVIMGDSIMTEKVPVAFRRFDSKYHFQWMVVPTSSNVVRYLQSLVKNGQWELKYRDGFYSYYVKK